MDQPDIDLQLKAWKELAVNKQILLRVVTDALGLHSECSSDELKETIRVVTKQGAAADARANQAQEQAKEAISDMEKKLKESLQARQAAESATAEAVAAQQVAEERMAAARAANAREVKKYSKLLAEKERAIKGISIALADTPENVVKKLKSLRKEKMEEATERKRAEATANSLRKEKKTLQERTKELQAALENSGKLIEKYRELHQVCTAQYEQLETRTEEGEKLTAPPELDEQLIESVQQTVDSEEK